MSSLERELGRHLKPTTKRNQRGEQRRDSADQRKHSQRQGMIMHTDRIGDREDGCGWWSEVYESREGSDGPEIDGIELLTLVRLFVGRVWGIRVWSR